MGCHPNLAEKVCCENHLLSKESLGRQVSSEQIKICRSEVERSWLLDQIQPTDIFLYDLQCSVVFWLLFVCFFTN